jgi:hypothetical protein
MTPPDDVPGGDEQPEPSIIPSELEIKDAPIAISGDNIYIVW